MVYSEGEVKRKRQKTPKVRQEKKSALVKNARWEKKEETSVRKPIHLNMETTVLSKSANILPIKQNIFGILFFSTGPKCKRKKLRLK